jgi:hypothetical protein
LFGGPKMQEFMKNQFLDDTPIEAELLSKSLDSAQQRLEELTYDSRKIYLNMMKFLINSGR